jgi:hypothetical protein
MNADNQPEACHANIGGAAPVNRFGLWVLLLLSVYAVGLTHGISRPWTGMHDWNGAFFSQLARNLLRYPLSVHHGMPVVAVGDAVPPPEERSIYATHPPGLVWLVAAAFCVFGEAEWAARLVPIIASLGSLGLFVWLVRRAWGRELAILAGLVYAVMPMAVFFGRMVDHEAVCLLFMLGATAAWQIAEGGRSALHRRLGMAAWIVSIFGAVLIDWPGIIFGALWGLHVLMQWRRGRTSATLAAVAMGVPAAACLVMLIHLVYAGLDGNWGDLVAIFLSRATVEAGEAMRRDASATGGLLTYTAENLSWPILFLAATTILRVVVPASERHDSPPANRVRPGSRRTPISGAWVLPATGLLWVCVFWRQYERHNYWLFYLGPVAAVMAASSLVAFRAYVAAVRPRLAYAAQYAAAGTVVLVASVFGTDDYFERVSYPDELAVALQHIQEKTPPDAVILLYENPVLVEQRGSYRFRNIVPPQLAYYLDRPFRVEQDLGAVPRWAGTCVVYLMPIAKVMELGRQIEVLRSRFPSVPLGPIVLFELSGGPPG